MRVAIGAVQEDVRCALTEWLGQALARRAVAFSIGEYRRAQDLLYEIEDGTSLDVVILVADGMPFLQDTIAAVRRARFSGKIVLASLSDAFAVDGYDWGVDDYWILPMSGERADAKLERLIEDCPSDCLTVCCRRTVHRLPFHRIVFIESRNSKCLIHCSDGEVLTVYCRLDVLASRLRRSCFLRCHQSFLVNMDHVVSADREFVLSDGHTAAIRQRDLKAIRDTYLAYCRHTHVVRKI